MREGERTDLDNLHRGANNESSEVIDILLPVTFYFHPSTRLDNATNFWRFVISHRGRPIIGLQPPGHCIYKSVDGSVHAFVKIA